ncbi:cupin domain-containing protein [Streptosporangium saharense]
MPLARGQVKHALPTLGENTATVVVQHIVMPPGGTTGWHYHPGPLLVVVSQGTLTHTLASDLSTETATAGQAFVEAAGLEHGHVGDNLGTEDLIMYAVYFLPAPDSPLAIDMDLPRPGPAGEPDTAPHP